MYVYQVYIHTYIHTYINPLLYLDTEEINIYNLYTNNMEEEGKERRNIRKYNEK